MKVFIAGLGLVLLLHGTWASGQNSIKVAVSVDLAAPMRQIAELYQNEKEQIVEIIAGFSGKLALQIEEGATYHIFVSSDMGYPQSLSENGFGAHDPLPVVLGGLVFWSRKMVAPAEITSYLLSDEVNKIIISDPTHSPYGILAKKWLKGQEVLNRVESKLQFSNHMEQTNSFIRNSSVEAAFTIISDKYSSELKGKGYWIVVEAKGFRHIPQGGMVLSYGANNNPEQSGDFFDFLFQEKAQDIFKSFGYISPNEKK